MLSACGGEKTPPKLPPPPSEDPSLQEVDPNWEPEEVGGAQRAEEEPKEPVTGVKETGDGKEPVFTPGMSVDEAVAAVPRHYDFVGIDQDALSKPLEDPQTFGPCNPGTQRFKVRIAVWQGKAVGVDVETPNAKLKKCLEEQSWKVEWKEKVRSINTVEYEI